jgi:hypothetical protein
MPGLAAAIWYSGTALFLRSRTEPSGSDIANLGRGALADAGVIREDATITVTRQSPDDAGFREIFISLDGERLGMLRHGESLTADVPSGLHSIRAHNTLFWKTHRIDLKPGEHARFVAVNRAGWGTFGMLFLLGAMPVYLTFERVPVENLATKDAKD